MDEREVEAARPPLLAAGQTFAGRSVQTYLGRGGSGEVYRTVDHRGQSEALKAIFPEIARTEVGLNRFRRECEIAESLDHPHLGNVHAHGADPSLGVGPPLLWSTMEYLGGGSAAALVPVANQLPDVSLVLEIVGQVAAGLDYLHGEDLVHRDVKPSNIMLDAGGPVRAVLTDFGLARFLEDARPLARNGRVEGSVAYAPPELLTAERLTPQTDVYELACTLTELLTGEPPYPKPTSFAIVYAHLSAKPPSLHRRRPDLPRALDAAVAHGLAKSAADRPTSCGAFVTEVAAAFDRV